MLPPIMLHSEKSRVATTRGVTLPLILVSP